MQPHTRCRTIHWQTAVRPSQFKWLESGGNPQRQIPNDRSTSSHHRCRSWLFAYLHASGRRTWRRHPHLHRRQDARQISAGVTSPASFRSHASTAQCVQKRSWSAPSAGAAGTKACIPRALPAQAWLGNAGPIAGARTPMIAVTAMAKPFAPRSNLPPAAARAAVLSWARRAGTPQASPSSSRCARLRSYGGLRMNFTQPQRKASRGCNHPIRNSKK